MAYQNPEAGKILGYIYESTQKPDTTFGGVPVIKKSAGDNEYYEAMPGTAPDIVQEGRGYKVVNRGSDNEQWIPISTEPLKTTRTVTPSEGAKQIPLYASPFASTINERAMTKDEQFSVAAQLAGASDMPIRTGDIGEGLMQSRFLSADVRKALGLPNSIDVVRGVDPTKQDWGAQSWKLEYPKTTGFFEDLSSFGKALLTETPILQALAGGAPVGTDIAANMVAQEAAQVAMEQAVTNALSGTATQAATAAATNAVAQGGISSLLNTVKDLGSTISKEVADTLNGMGIKGISEQAVNKAGMSAAKAAITGGNPLQAALSSVATTGAVENTKDLLSTIDPGIAKTVASAVGGATQAAIGGGDVGLAALTSGATTGISEAVKGSELLKGVDPELKNVINSVAKSVTGAALAGGDLASAVSQGVLSGAMTPTAKPAQPSPAKPAAPVDADELINQMIRAQEPITPMEQLIDYAPEVTPVEPPPDLRAVELPSEAETFPVLPPEQPISQQDLTDQIAETFPIAPPEEITEAPASLDDIISQLQEQAQQQQTLEQALAAPQKTTTATEDWIDQQRLISNPLEIEIAGTAAAEPTEYATPTESWIDRAGLAEQPKTLDQFLAELEARDAARPTPTEEYIDTGGLTGGFPTTPTEDYIDAGGLGGGGGMTPGGGGAAPGPSGADRVLQQLQQQQQQYAAQQQRQSDMGSLLAMLGVMGASQPKAPPPIPVVGEIKPYQFSTDLLEGIYQKPRMAQGGSINDLMRIVRG